MTSSSMGPLKRRLEAVATQLEKEQGPQEVTFQTYWGDEEVPDDGNPVFRTEWGGGPVDEEEEDGACQV